MIFRIALFAAAMLALLGLALATAEEPPTLKTGPDQKAEITLNIPIYVQLLTPIVTILGCVAAVGRKMGRIELLISQHSDRMKYLENTRVSRDACRIEHHALETRIDRIEDDVREARG